ncbi:MAG: diphthine--ammonia ligase [Gemmatimonadaceae bacterium]
MKTIKAIFNWSTGKDSALALYNVLQAGEYDVRWLLTTVNARHDRVSMHGVRTELLGAQARSLRIPLVKVLTPDTPTMEAYEHAMGEALEQLRQEGATATIFGDIFLEDLRAYREQESAKLGLQAVFPLWGIRTDELARNVIELGFRAITSCVNDRYLDRTFVGRQFDHSFVQDLPEGVDPCGENGEFHTFTYDGPVFQHPVPVALGEVVHRRYDESREQSDESSTTSSGSQPYECRTASNAQAKPSDAGFWYCDLLPE